MKFMKLFWFIILSWMFAFTASAYSTWTDPSTGIQWTYTVQTDGTVSLGDGYYYPAVSKSTTGNLIIPSTINGKSVTSIGSYAFYNCSWLTSVTIPSSVTSIGYAAFSGCSGLTSVTIPACVTKLSTTFPSAYTKIKEVVILEGVTSIGECAFYGCSGLTSVTIPSSVTSIGSYAFYYCDGLTSMTIPASVTSIGSSAFEGCSGLTSVTIPACVTRLSTTFPSAYTKIKEVVILDGVTSIGECAFYGCSGLTSVTIPSSVTSIGSDVFSGTKLLNDHAGGLVIIDNCLIKYKGTCSGEVVIPNGVRLVAGSAFYNCSGLTSVTIPSSVTSVGSQAFSGCAGLAVNVTDLAAWCGISFDSADANPLYYTKKLYLNGKEVIYLNIPAGVVEVKPYAFHNCNRIMSVSIPSSVTRIGEWAFYGCSQLTSMIIPSGVKSIGERAFSDCSGLTSVTIPTSMTSIGAGAFYNCRGLTSMTIPSSVTEIGEGAFTYCSGVKTVTMPGWFALKDVFPSNYSSIRDVTILAGEKVLSKEVFAGCTGLKTVVIPEGVTTLGEDLFYNLWNLTELTIPSTVTSIGGYALYGCSSLKTIHVSNNGDIEALKQMLYESGFDTTGITFDHIKAPDLTYCKVTLDARGGSAAWTETEVVSGGSIGELPPATREGYEFLGWWTSAVGGTQVTAATVVTEDVTFYAQWRVDTSDVEETWSVDEGFSSEVANVYDGYAIGADCNVVGIVQVKTTKQSVKKGVVTITATAAVTDANGKKWSYSKGVVEIRSGASLTSGKDSASPLVGVVTGLKCTAKGCPVAEFGVVLGQNGLEGEWGEYSIFGARNGMGTKGDAMMAALEAYKGKWSVTLSCASLTSGKDSPRIAPASQLASLGGYASPLVARLQLNVQAKGVVKIAGNWESGAKVSASAQLVMGDGFAYVPVMVKQTKTSPAVNALLRIDADGEVALLSGGELIAGGRTVEALGEPVYLPSEVSVGGKAFGARVAVNELAYPAKFAAKKLPAGLKIDAATGVISGTPTKPGHYVAEVTVTSGLNSKVKKTLTVEFDIANYTDNLIPIKDSYGPYYVGVSAEEQIAAAAGCTASGLPSGLKWTANTIYGVPTKACTSTVYFKKTVKEMVNGKQKSVTHQASATFIVEGMKPWAIGTFDGGMVGSGASLTSGKDSASPLGGMVQLTVAKTGKISGKWMSEGLTWTLSAASFDAYDAEREAYHATVTAKSGKETKTLELVHEDGYICASLTSGKDSASPLWEAWRNGWKEEPQKTLATKLKGKKVTVGENGNIVLTVGASGAVTAKGTFDGYSASCSTVLIPTAEAGLYRVYLYFPPKSGKFDGFADVVEIGLGDSQ